MYKPQFPYLGKQIILTSDRVMLYAKNDSVFIIGKEAVGISTQKTFNVDASEKVKISSPKIELGLSADQQVMLGTNYVKYFREFLEDLESGVALELRKAAAGNLYTSMLAIATAGINMQNSINKLKESLNNTLSNTTYTK